MTLTSEMPPPLIAELEGKWNEVFAGDWFPIMVRLKCPENQAQTFRIRNIDCSDKEVQLESDLLQRDVEIRPGETYRFAISLNISRVRVVNLSSIYVQLAGKNDDMFYLPDQELEVRPSLARDISIDVESFCSYGNVTKLQLTFHHQGAAPYQNLRISFGPENVVHAAKQQIFCTIFNPNDKEVAMVAASGDLVLTLAATVGDGTVLTLKKFIAVCPVERKNGQPFRFLEPDRLSTDQIVIRDKNRRNDPIGLARSAYPLYGGGSYHVVIRPQRADATKIELQDVPGAIFVREYGYDEEEGGWRYEIDVLFSELLIRSERLIYRVIIKDGKEGRLTGEIHLTLIPPALKRWKFAIAVGVAATAQGVAALTRLILNPELSMEELFGNFSLSQHYPVLLLFSIPFVWLGTTLFDRLQYRLRT